MKLSRIVLEEFRKFRQPLALDGLQPGLNLFVGPNEAGKSTVAAAIRAAFSSATAPRRSPIWRRAANPAHGPAWSWRSRGRDYVLKKQFLTKARCELLIDGGAERRTARRPRMRWRRCWLRLARTWTEQARAGGHPGLLWIQQGEGQSLSAPAGHAQGHLREALTRLSGELAAGDGDRLFERVSAERGALLDARNGKRACSRMPMRRWARAVGAMTLCAPRRSWTRTSTGWPPCAENMGRRSKPSPGRRWKRGRRGARAWRPGARARDAGRLAPRAGAGRQQPGPVAGSGRARPAG